MRQVVCDQCGKTAEKKRWCGAPDSWFYVEQEFDELFEDRDWHFCSADCVATFFILRRLPAPQLL